MMPVLSTRSHLTIYCIFGLNTVFILLYKHNQKESSTALVVTGKFFSISRGPNGMRELVAFPFAGI